jgi:bacteriorhodopsin
LQQQELETKLAAISCTSKRRSSWVAALVAAIVLGALQSIAVMRQQQAGHDRHRIGTAESIPVFMIVRCRVATR